MEQQIYKSNISRSMTKNLFSRCIDDEDEYMNPKNENGIKSNDTSKKLSYDEAKMILRLEKNVLDRIDKYF